MTPTQERVLAILPVFGERGMTARDVARAAWPDDPGWQRWTAGRGASSFNGCLGGTMPLRAGRVLANLERAGLAFCERDPNGPRGGRWTRRPGR